MALRGHASIQGSTDIPTLFNLLPGYLPMPKAGTHDSLQAYLDAVGSKKQKGFWANADTYMISLLKAWWGDAARQDNDWAYDYLPRLTGPHGTYQTVIAMLADEVEGYFLLGQNPAIGSANGRMQRLGMSHLKWLVVRDLNLIESATWWKDGPEIASGELRAEDIETEVFFLPAATHVEKAGSFTQTQRLMQWRHKAVEPPGDSARASCNFFELGKRIRQRLAGSTDERDRPLLDLTWDYPADEHGDPDGERPWPSTTDIAVTGPDAGKAAGEPVVVHRDARRRVDRRRLLDLHRVYANATNRLPPGTARRPVAEPITNGVGRGRPIGGFSTTARPPTRTASRGASARSTSGGTRTTTVGRVRHAGLRGRPGAGQPARSRARWPGRAGRRRSVRDAGRRQGLAVRTEGHGRRTTAHALRTAGVAGRQPAVSPTAKSGANHLPAQGQSERAQRRGPRGRRLSLRLHDVSAH